MITLVFLFLASCHSVVHWAKNYFYCSVKLSRELGSGGGGVCMWNLFSDIAGRLGLKQEKLS